MTTPVSNPRVAIVDDDRNIRELLEMSLRSHGFDTRSARDGQLGLQLIIEWKPDVIVLDVMMPKIDGIALIPLIRNHCESPILMLSAKGDVDDRVAGIERGADDYLTKPFSTVELVARIRGALRRPRLESPEYLCVGDLVVDVEKHRVTRREREIALTAREYALLLVLIRHPGRVFTREHLLDRVWSDCDVSPASVDTYISYLRGKIDVRDGPSLIHTVRGAGYTLRET